MSLSRRLIMAQPKLFLAARGAVRTLAHRNEREMDILPLFVPRNRAAMDVGANRGLYSERLLGLASHVVAVEPNPGLAQELRRLFPAVTVVEAAVSDVPGEAVLRIPSSGEGEATINEENTLVDGGAIRTVTVPTVRLDDIAPGDVGFVKIDVEGHEFAALKSGMEMIRRDRPVLLIESEERHRAGSIASIRRMLEAIGYQGFFVWRGSLVSITAFREAIHQDVRNRLGTSKDTRDYANNFFFLPTEQVS